jgi:hypothetical protein
MGPPCDGKAKKTAIAARTSKAPVVWRAYRELLFDGVSWPNRCGAATLMRWVVDGVTRSPSIPRSRSYRIRRFPYVGFMTSWGCRGRAELEKGAAPVVGPRPRGTDRERWNVTCLFSGEANKRSVAANKMFVKAGCR